MGGEVARIPRDVVAKHYVLHSIPRLLSAPRVAGTARARSPDFLCGPRERKTRHGSLEG